MSGYVLSPAAQSDLDAIWDYTTERWGEDQAERYVFSIRSALDGLAAGRAIARSAHDIRTGYRKHAVGLHFIFFRVGSEGNIVVIRILHQQMDIAAHLTGEG